MKRRGFLCLTPPAPAVGGIPYLAPTEMLPAGSPMPFAMLRAFPAGLLLMLFIRQLPKGIWWGRIFVLGALNFAVFWWLLFVSAYRLPGGVAATVGAIQPLIVLLLSRMVLGNVLKPLAVLGALCGIGGVALLLLTPQAKLDTIGIIAGLAGAFSMAAGTVLSRRWQPDVSPLTFTTWQLTAGGLLLLPVSLLLEPALPPLTLLNISGLLYLGLIGAALTYLFWFRGLAILGPNSVASLGFLSPLTAVLLGWFVLDQQLSLLQCAGVIVVIGSVWLSQVANRR